MLITAREPLMTLEVRVEISEVRISPSKGGKVRAFVSIVLDDSFIVNDLRILEGREGQLFVTMPARKTRNGQMRETAHPLNMEKYKGQYEEAVKEGLTGVAAEKKRAYEEALKNRAVPVSRRGRKAEKQSTLDRLASRLFNDEFWMQDEKQSSP